MAQTINKTIGGVFSNEKYADKAVEAFKEIGVLPQYIQLFVQRNQQRTTELEEETPVPILVKHGVAESQARYYDSLVTLGRVLVVVHDVVDAGPVIDIFDKYHAIHNPDGSRNMREDVMGMTVGAAVGATALGLAGGIVAGPLGAAIGVATGAIVGGGSGAVVGKSSEHSN